MTTRRTAFGFLGAGALATFIAYLPALRVGFVFDDYPNLIVHPALQWTELTMDNIRALFTATLLPRRVVANVTLALNHLAGGLDPWGYHLVNICIHLAVGGALAWLGYRYLIQWHGRTDRHRLALVAVIPAVLFLLHPLNTQAVTYVVQRMASMAALFCILAFGTYLVARGKESWRASFGWYVVTVVLWVLALGSKENAVALPAVLVLYEWAFKGNEWRQRVAGWLSTPRGRTLVGTGVLAVVGALVLFVVMYVGNRPFQFTTTWTGRDFNGIERMLTQSRVQWLYLSLLAWPVPGRLTIDHAFEVSRGLLNPATTVLALTLWVGIGVGAVMLTRRRPMYGFPLLAYGVFHLLEAGPVNLELVFEHRMYLPLTMLALLGAAALADFKPERLRVVPAFAVVVIMLLGWGTYRRNLVWADPLLFAYDVAEKAPHKFRPQHNLSNALVVSGNVEEGLAVIKQALALEPENPEGHLQLGIALMESDSTMAAMLAFQRALELEPNNVRAEYRIGQAMEQHGSREQAVRYYLNLGTRLGMNGQPFEALYPLERAVTLDSTNSFARNALGNAYWLADRLEKAVPQYRAAITLEPRNVQAVYNLGRVLEELGDTEAALAEYRRFVEIAPPPLARQIEEVRERLLIMRR